MGVTLADDRRWKGAAGPLAMLLVGVWALARSWAMGPDIQVDFGRELYLPWRLSEGERLYDDIAYFNGPLSVYWHALWFSIAGVGLSTLKVLNLATTVVMAGLIYKIFVRLSDRLAGSVAGVFFVGALAFGQFQPIGNYDYLTPYSHELIHGIALSLLALHEFVRRDARSSTFGVAVRSGAILALVFLTKIEVFAALAAALAALAAALAIGFALELGADAKSRAGAGRVVGAFAAAFGGVLVVAFGILASAVGASSAFLGMLEPIRAALGTGVAELPYYRWVMGTLEPAQSLREIGIWLIRYGLVFLPLLGLSAVWSRKGLDRFAPVAGLLFAIAAIAFPLEPKFAIDAIRPLPVLIPMLLALLIRKWIDRRSREIILPICVLTFGFVLQFKMLLNAQFGHYGFALMMPSSLVLIAVLVGWVPDWIERRGGSGSVFRLGACAAILAVALGLVARTDANFARRTEPIGHGSDAFLSDFRTKDVSDALVFLERLDADTRVAVLPEGIMLNYLARRVTPTRYINFMPPEMSLYGSDTIIEAFRRDSPDYVVFVHKRTGLYGVPFFGRDYGRALHSWVIANYHVVETFGGRPFDEKTRFGITILARDVPGS
ncbi:MAG: hypothetical protein JRG94_25350 [Deltaproteobacteria bacterium]|nr:hypothetical protein [Deltaproteobacteria bacterium]